MKATGFVCALYLAAGATTAAAFVEINHQRCVNWSASEYGLYAAIWPAVGVAAIYTQLGGNHAPSFCQGEPK